MGRIWRDYSLPPSGWGPVLYLRAAPKSVENQRKTTNDEDAKDAKYAETAVFVFSLAFILI